MGLLIWKEILGSVHIFGIALIVGAWRCSTSPSSRSYSPECVEGKFCEVELPLYGVLGSSPGVGKMCSSAEEP